MAPSSQAPPSEEGTSAAHARHLGSHLPSGGESDPDVILDRFLDWVGAIGFELYPAQEEAVLELFAGRHVVLDTPTGSGKSLVALALHFKALCEGRRSFYTSPIKALASEKFFSLCDELGAERVGMLTGDASINPDAPVICCTAEILSNMALRQGEDLDAPYVVMDEFHYYADPERGVAWQVPLIVLRDTLFLLMSATLGNTAPISERLERRSARQVTRVSSTERPVPLDFEYRETPLHETVSDLLAAAKSPIYVVSFTQRECAELAQALTSIAPADRPERQQIRAAIGEFRFTSPYGKVLKRFLGFGIGVHHAGLLPRYRLLVEQLSQQGLLKVICGTDTLGVGVNIPIRTVLFTRLAKYDGRQVGILTAREFKQIAGRAGRRGFDDQGSVVCQAPEHVIENRRRERRAVEKGRRRKVHRQQPKGEVSWTGETFDSLIARPPEVLESRFAIGHGMILATLQRDAERRDPDRDNFASLRELVAHCHEPPARHRDLLSEAAQRVRSLNRAGVLRAVPDTRTSYYWIVVDDELQWDFSLLQTLSLFIVETLEELDPQAPDYPLLVLSVVEAVLEDPRAVLYRQQDVARRRLLDRLKAEGVPYEERLERIAEVSWPRPEAELLEAAFEAFRRGHPWVGGDGLRPKSVAREMFEGYLDFDEYVLRYGLQRSEGVLLRYLSQVYKTLSLSVPIAAKTEGVYDAEGFYRSLVERVDTSLLLEWESLLHPAASTTPPEEREAQAEKALRAWDLHHDPAALAARMRAEMHQLVRCLTRQDYESAALLLRSDGASGEWTPQRLEEALEPFVAEYGRIDFTPRARESRRTRIDRRQPGVWEVRQVLTDPQEDDLWCLEAVFDLRGDRGAGGEPIVDLLRIGT